MSNNKDDYDYGFTFEEEVNLDQIKNSSIEEHAKDLKKIENLVLPLLESLQKNPDTPIIKWPNRKEILEKKKQELLSITRKYQ